MPAYYPNYSYLRICIVRTILRRAVQGVFPDWLQVGTDAIAQEGAWEPAQSGVSTNPV